MSIRREPKDSVEYDPALLREELEQLGQNARQEAAAATTVSPASSVSSAGVFTREMRDFAQLTPTEKQAASLGVHPDSLKPISSLNEAHFEALLQANALSPQLAASIKAFQRVAAGQS